MSDYAEEQRARLWQALCADPDCLALQDAYFYGHEVGLAEFVAVVRDMGLDLGFDDAIAAEVAHDLSLPF
jgi:hypothetical protein